MKVARRWVVLVAVAMLIPRYGHAAASTVGVNFAGEIKAMCSIVLGEEEVFSGQLSVILTPVHAHHFSTPGLYKPLQPKYFPIHLKGCTGPDGNISAKYSAVALDTLTNTLANTNPAGPPNIGIIVKAAQDRSGVMNSATSDITFSLPIVVGSGAEATIWLMADYFLQRGVAAAGPITAAMTLTVVLR